MAKRRGNNEGSITLHKSGLYMARITVGRTPDGTSKRKTFYNKSKQELQKEIRQVLRDMDLGLYVDNEKMTVTEWLDIWLWNYKKQSSKPKTMESYDQVIRCYLKPAVGNIMLSNLRPDHVQKMLNDLTVRIPERVQKKIKELEGMLKTADQDAITDINKQISEYCQEHISPRTVRYTNVLLHGALEQALKNGLVVRNVAEAVTVPKQSKKEMRVLTPEEQNIFIKTLKQDRLGAIFMLAMGTGLRCSELLGLRWDKVDLKNRSLKVSQILHRVKDFTPGAEKKTKIIVETPKTQKSLRNIPLLDDIVEMLKAHKIRQTKERLLAGEAYEDSGYVFTDELGKSIMPEVVFKRFYALVKLAGINKANIHCLRHSFATRGLENGIELKVMQELLGHSSISLTGDTYSHVLPEKKKEAISKLEGVFSQMV